MVHPKSYTTRWWGWNWWWWRSIWATGAWSQTVEQAKAALAAITQTELYGTRHFVGSEIEKPNDTVIRANSPVHQLCDFENLLILPFESQHVEYSAYYFGWNHKKKNETKWKWKSIDFSNFAISDGSLPNCYEANVSGGSEVLIVSPFTATAQINFRVVFKINCLFGYQWGDPKVIVRTKDFDSNRLYY